MINLTGYFNTKDDFIIILKQIYIWQFSCTKVKGYHRPTTTDLWCVFKISLLF